MIGTFISVTSVSMMAMQGQLWGAQAWTALGTALGAALLANISIVGLNQCFDVAVDRINKPYLPLASGEWSLKTGWTVVLITGVAALWAAYATASVPLMVTVGVSILLGIVYSVDLPFLRWKRSPLAAAACILAVRAILVQLGFWSHMRLAVADGPLQPTGDVLFMTAFMFFFSVVIALFKDIPDVRGDEQNGTRTASVRFGTKRVFWACIWMLNTAYTCAVAYIFTFCTGWTRIAALAGQLCLAGALQRKAHATDLSKHSDIVSAYMFVWTLFYAQYLVLPFLC